MVINVDMPFTEIGWGSVHMEDTVVITDDGFERLSEADFGLQIIDKDLTPYLLVFSCKTYNL
ncbi:MAG: hypothetical protein Ct9H300mP6_15170 [Gammaproteobacteria bacterium]|nr:MAG: hypothetical protein Ct9H300mP6_15170 [Gammaproteobacteria bacterium]